MVGRHIGEEGGDGSAIGCRMRIAVQASIGAGQVAAEVAAGGAAAPRALTAGAVGAAGGLGGMKGSEEFAVNAAGDGEAGLGAGEKLQAEVGGEGGEVAEELGLRFRGRKVKLDARGRKAANHLAIGGDKRGVHGRNAGASEGLGEAEKKIEVEIGEPLISARHGDERVVAPVNPARVTEVGNDRVKKGELRVGRRDTGLEEGSAQTGNSPVHKDLSHAS